MLERASPAPAAEQLTETFRSCQALFQAMGEPTRQSIILLLAGHDALNVGQIAEQMPLSRPAISHHLKVLRAAGLLQVVSKGTENYYSLEIDAALALLKLFVVQVETACASNAS